MGKAKTFSDDAKDSVYQKEADNELFSTAQQNSYNLGSTHFSDQSGIGNFSQAGGDQRKANLKGVLFRGNVGFDLQTVLLDVGTEVIDLNNDSAGVALSVISTDRFVTLSAGSTSDLTTITGAQRPGQRLRLYNTTTNTITIKHTAAATVNTIRTPTATDLNFPGNAVIDFTFDTTSAQWRVVGNTGSGGGGGTQTPWLTQIEGAGFTLNEAGKIVIKPTQTDGLDGILELIRNDTTPANSDTLGTILFKGPDSGATEQIWASIDATYEDVTAGAKQGQFTIRVQKDNSLLSIIDYTGDDATFRFSSGVDVIRANANGTKELGTASFFWDDVFSETFTLRGSGGNTTGSARTIYADGTTMVFNMPSGGFTHSVNNAIFSLLTDGELEVRTTLVDGPTLRLRNNDQTPTSADEAATILFTGEDSALDEVTYGSIQVQMNNVTDGATQANMVFRAQNDNSLKVFMNYLGDPAVGDDKINMFQFLDMNSNYIEFDDRSVPDAPASTERILFSDSTNSAHLTIRTDTGTIDLEAASGSQTPWLQDIDADGFDLTDLSNIEFRTTTGAPAGTVQAIYATTGGVILNVPSNDVIQFRENDVLTHSWSDFVNNIIRVSTGALGPVFQLTLDSSTPADDDVLGTLVYGGRDSANNLQTYAEIQGISADVTSGSENGQLKFNVASGTGALVEAFTLRSISSLPVIGFFGDSGTVRPTITGSRAGNAALADLLTSLDSMGLITDSTT